MNNSTHNGGKNRFYVTRLVVKNRFLEACLLIELIKSPLIRNILTAIKGS